jgi:phage-related protein
MRNFESKYYKTGAGHSPVASFIDSLSYKTQRKFFTKIEWLEELGPRLAEPHSKKIEDDLYELRFEGEDGAIRVIYFFYVGHKIILLNGFKKKTRKLPKRELELAKKRKADFLTTLSSCVVEESAKITQR